MADENGSSTTPSDQDQGNDSVKKAIQDSGQGAAGDQKELKDQLGEALGKQFPDNETALKAVKDTFSYVGKMGNLKDLDSAMGQLQKVFNADQKGVLERIGEIVKTGGQVDPSRFVPREDFERTTFYHENTDYKPYTKFVETFKKANPEKSREEIVESDDFKEEFEKIKAHDDAQSSKSVLKSNPKLGGVSDKITESRKDLSEGRQEEAEKKAVGAVLDAFPPK